VDDSAVMRSLLRSVVSAAPGLEVVGTTADGASALTAIDSLRPGLVLLDVEMPVMDGLVTLKKLRSQGHRMPVVMCSALTRRGAKVTIEALASGASDYVAKPAGQADRQAAIQTLTQDLIPKIRALTSKPQLLRPTDFPLCTAAEGAGGIDHPEGCGHWRFHRWSGGPRRTAPGTARKLSSAGTCRAAHAGDVYPLACRPYQRSLPSSSARGSRG
jgi:two-component system chemotaxis response regulator CheB